MKVQEVSIHNCRIGDILASDVIALNGAILAARDTQINDYIKDHLIALGIDKIRIFNSHGSIDSDDICLRKFKNRYLNIVFQTKSALQDMAAGKPLDMDKVSLISEQIGKHIYDNENIIRCLSTIRQADEYTYTHCVNVAFYSMLIAKWTKLSEIDINKAIVSGLLHDIGKSKIPNKLLNKGGTLTREEYEVIKQHTVLGYQIAKEVEGIDNDVRDTILLHHERMDGSGYPMKYLSDSINLHSRIVAVADVFDAMTSDRVYKKRSTPFEAFEMFKTVGMSMFDTDITSVFLKRMAIFLVGSKVQLSNGQTGEIVFVPLQNIMGPIVRTSSGYLDLSADSTVKISGMI